MPAPLRERLAMAFFVFGPFVVVAGVLLWVFTHGNLWACLFIVAVFAVVALQIAIVAHIQVAGRVANAFSRYIGVRLSTALGFVFITHIGWRSGAMTLALYAAIDIALLVMRYFEQRRFNRPERA